MRLARVASVTQRSVEIFGSTERAEAWLRRPNEALAAQTPLSLLDTDDGARRVESVLGRLEHGLFS